MHQRSSFATTTLEPRTTWDYHQLCGVVLSLSGLRLLFPLTDYTGAAGYNERGSGDVRLCRTACDSPLFRAGTLSIRTTCRLGQEVIK